MMKIFSWVTKDTTINFMGARKLTYVLSVGMFVLAIACIAFKGFNYGIDFSGGILIELKAEDKINVEEMRNKLDHIDLDDVNIQTIGEIGDEVMIRAQAKGLDEKNKWPPSTKLNQPWEPIMSTAKSNWSARRSATS